MREKMKHTSPHQGLEQQTAVPSGRLSYPLQLTFNQRVHNSPPLLPLLVPLLPALNRNV